MNTSEKQDRARKLRALASTKESRMKDVFIDELTRQIDEPADWLDEAYFRDLEHDIKRWPNATPATTTGATT